MAGIQQAKREKAVKTLLDVAIACVAEKGIDALHARELAQRSGYSIGTVYKYYKDLDDILIQVNSRTLDGIKRAVGEAIADLRDPLARLKAMAQAYYAFAAQNRQLWEALFGHRLPDGETIPDAHRQDNTILLSVIATCLAELNPTLPADQLEARSRTCFAAVHGLTTVSVERRYIGLQGDLLASEMDFMVERLARSAG